VRALSERIFEFIVRMLHIIVTVGALVWGIDIGRRMENPGARSIIKRRRKMRVSHKTDAELKEREQERRTSTDGSGLDWSNTDKN
jgi:hypothetical protein